MAYLRPVNAGHQCNACGVPARNQLFTYGDAHSGYYCVKDSEGALQRLRDAETAALFTAKPLPKSLDAPPVTRQHPQGRQPH